MQNIQLSPHFELREFIASRTAKEHGIDNTPPNEAVENLRALCVHTLEPLREALGLPIIITSGYRNKTLNQLLVFHSTKSQHMNGEAADFYVAQGPVQGRKAASSRFKVQSSSEAEASSSKFNVQGESRRELLIKAFRTIILDERITFDQLIIYPTFIHVSYVRSGKNRSKLTRGFGNGKYCALSRAEAMSLV